MKQEAFIALVIPALVQIVIILAIIAWGQWVAQRHRGIGWQRAVYMPIASCVLSVLGAGVSAIFIVRAFSAVGSADPASKAALLAESVSSAMNWVAALSFLANALAAASVVTFGVGTLLRPKS